MQWIHWELYKIEITHAKYGGIIESNRSTKQTVMDIEGWPGVRILSTKFIPRDN